MSYWLDDRLTPEESAHLWEPVDRRTARPVYEEGFYTAVIRRRGEEGWVFRFRDPKHAIETLARLNVKATVSVG